MRKFYKYLYLVSRKSRDLPARGIKSIHPMLYFNMPANLPPEYYEAEKRFKQASSHQEKIAALEALISTVPKHKGTDKLRADLRKRLSRVREESVRKKKAGKGDLYTVEKQGAAQVALVGLPNSGKSSVLDVYTNASPAIADYPLSTVMPLSGMMAFEDIQFQLVDLPPLGNDSTDGWVSGIVRNADMLLIIIDLSDDPDAQAEVLISQLKSWKIPLLKKGDPFPSDSDTGGKPLIIVGNKSDLEGTGEGIKNLKQKYDSFYPIALLSVAHKDGIEELRRMIFEHSRIIRVYSKEPGKDADMKTPFTLPHGSTVLDLAGLIHKDFRINLKFACIWGSAKYDGQRVQRNYVLHDLDIVEYHIK